jgi:hypothetical protein
MAFLSKQNISKALSEDNNSDTTVNRALYFKPVNYILKKYFNFNLTENNISQHWSKSKKSDIWKIS